MHSPVFCRAWTSQGVTQAVRFIVGEYPEILEQESDGEAVPAGSTELEHEPMRLGPRPVDGADTLTPAEEAIGGGHDGAHATPPVPPTTAATAPGEPPRGS